MRKPDAAELTPVGHANGLVIREPDALTAFTQLDPELLDLLSADAIRCDERVVILEAFAPNGAVISRVTRETIEEDIAEAGKIADELERNGDAKTAAKFRREADAARRALDEHDSPMLVELLYGWVLHGERVGEEECCDVAEIRPVWRTEQVWTALRHRGVAAQPRVRTVLRRAPRARASRARRANRTHGPPGRPRSTGDDDPPHDLAAVVAVRAAA